MKTTIALLEDLSKKGSLRQELRFYCPHCKQLVGSSFETINSLPDSYCCEACGNEMNSPLEDVIVTYRKLRWYSFKES